MSVNFYFLSNQWAINIHCYTPSKLCNSSSSITGSESDSCSGEAGTTGGGTGAGTGAGTGCGSSGSFTGFTGDGSLSNTSCSGS